MSWYDSAYTGLFSSVAELAPRAADPRVPMFAGSQVRTFGAAQKILRRSPTSGRIVKKLKRVLIRWENRKIRIDRVTCIASLGP